jgi:adenylate cyclase
MAWPSRQSLVDSITLNRRQIAMILIVLMLFLANVSGFIDFNTQTPPWFAVKFSRLAHGMPLVLKSMEFNVLLVTGTIMSLLLPALKPVPASILTFLCTIPSIYINAAYPLRKPLVTMEYSLLIILMLYAINVLFTYFNETRNKQKIIEVFGQYIPPELVTEISKHPESMSLDGDSRKLTVFFCDLINFSGIAEQLNPKQLVMLLNEYFTAMTGILYQHGATIDKYIGDSIMAFWGAPLIQEDHARRAVMASFEMHVEIKRLSGEFIKKGWPGPDMGVGINTGMMNVGNMGSKYRISYTVIGDAVNLGSRLQTLTRTYQVPTIVGEETAQNIDDVVFRELDTVTVRGKRKQSRIYQPVCLKSDLDEALKDRLAAHRQALESYYDGDYSAARKQFAALQASAAQDLYYGRMIETMAKKTNGD